MKVYINAMSPVDIVTVQHETEGEQQFLNTTNISELATDADPVTYDTGGREFKVQRFSFKYDVTFLVSLDADPLLCSNGDVYQKIA